MGEFRAKGKNGHGLPIALDTRDPEDAIWLALHNIKVIFNGEIVRGIVAFDEAKGQLTRPKLDDESKPVIDKRRGVFVMETVKGDVKVEWA